LFCFDHVEIHPLPENPVEYFFGIFKEDSSLTRALLRKKRRILIVKGKRGEGMD